MQTRQFLVSFRLLFVVVSVVTIAWQLTYSGLHQPTFSYINFFSFFTILSNIFATFVLLIGAVRVARGYKVKPIDEILRGASVLYMVVTGVIYTILLSGKDVGLTLPFVNLQLHFIMPLVVVLDWILQPFKHQLEIRQALWWMLSPALYLVYSLVRGNAVGWYPYPFLNPELAGGYGGVAVYCVGVMIVLLVASFLLLRLGNILKLKRRA